MICLVIGCLANPLDKRKKKLTWIGGEICDKTIVRERKKNQEIARSKGLQK